jgi:uncharacterized protein YjbI with pentapeptide repeats
MTRAAQIFSGESAHLEVLREAAHKKDPGIWNRWRKESGVDRPNLRGADLSGLVLHEVNLRLVDLAGANLTQTTITAALDYAVLNEADLTGARMWSCRFDETQLVGVIGRDPEFCGSRIVASNFSNAKLQNANFEKCYLEDTFFDDADLAGSTFRHADLWMAYLRNAILDQVDFRGANLHGANLAGATLTRCDLQRSILVDSNIQGTTIRDCDIYGISAWNLNKDKNTVQENLRVSKREESPLYVEDIEVAQFIHLMVNNQRIRDVIDTVSRKAVLILGRFTPERKAILDGIRTRLRQLGYVPIIFDFEKPAQRDFEETVRVLAGLSRFVIVDITKPMSAPLEIHATVPEYMIPFVPIIEHGAKQFSMFEGLQTKFHWVLPTLSYPSPEALIRNLEKEVISPALSMEAMIAAQRAKKPQIRVIPE